MKQSITEKHKNNLKDLINTHLETFFIAKELNNLIDEIVKFIKEDEFFIFDNKEIPKTSFYLFDLINKYHIAYKKSSNEYQQQRENTLESLKKGTKYRKKRYENNELKVDDDSLDWQDKISPYFENTILKLLLDGKQKSAYLALSFGFIFKGIIKNTHSRLFMFNKNYITTLNKIDESFEFFSFTYLAPSKIATSLAILIYQFVQIHFKDKIDSKDTIRFIKYVLNFYFTKDAPSQLKPNYFEDREIYCAGIYDNLPVFQWYVAKKKDQAYYTDENINEVKKFVNDTYEDTKELFKIIPLITLKPLSDDDIEKFKNPDTKDVKMFIENIPKAYLVNHQFSFYFQFKKYFKTSMKSQIISSIFSLYMVIIALITKFTVKKAP